MGLLFRRLSWWVFDFGSFGVVLALRFGLVARFSSCEY